MPKVKLTPEEKKALKEAKALAKKLAAEEADRQVKRDFLSRELKYGELNRQKLEKGWRQMLLGIKTPEVRTQFQLAVNNLERRIDAKDYEISLLMDELDEAEEQYNMNLRNDCEKIDQIIDIFHTRLDELKDRYDKEKKELFKNTDEELTDMKTRSKQEEEYLNMMLYGLEMEDKNVDKDMRSEYLSKLDEKANRNYNFLNLRKVQLENTFEKIWLEIKDTVTEYKEATAEQRKNFAVIFKQDCFMRNKIREQSQQIYNNYDKIKRLKEKQFIEKTELDEIMADYTFESKYFYDAFGILKSRLVKDSKKDEQQLILLVATSNDVVKELKKMVYKGEKILRLMSVCRKYETQEEKVKPFPKSLPEIVHHNMRISSIISLHDDVIDDLEPFWQKCGQGDALRHTLNEEREYLKRHNKLLRKRIKDYCTESACLCKLPSIRRSSSAKKSRKKGVGYIEAAHVAKNFIF